MAETVPGALHALLREIVDYAGLFPPAGLSMPDAVDQYATYHSSGDSWMLGRFVVPASRLDEFIAAIAPLDLAGRMGARWRLSALVGPDTKNDLARVVQFNDSRNSAVVDAVEAKALSVAGVDGLASVLPKGVRAYVELPITDDPEPLVAALAAAGLRGKARTGGVTRNLVPAAAAVARFMAACARHDLPFKLTAGLHHPFRAEYPLTYEPESVRATLFGFINVFMAAALAHENAPVELLQELLEETDRTLFHFDDDGAHWREHAVSTATIASVRSTFAIAFGSCSFREPVDEMHLSGRPLRA